MPSNRGGGADEPIPQAFLVVPKPGALTPEMEQARRAVLRTWLMERYVPGNLDWFPPKGTLAGRGVPAPFPDCVLEHPTLVTRLELAKLRSDQLEDGTVRGYTPEDWHNYNERRLLPLIGIIGGRCNNGHVDLTVVRIAPEVVMSPPPLPGEVRVRPEVGRAIPEGWRDHLPRDGAEMGQ